MNTTDEHETGRALIERQHEPCVRIRELLAAARQVGETDFERAWDLAWAALDQERAWPDDTRERRLWESALQVTRPEFANCWRGEMTSFGRIWPVIANATSKPP